MPVSCNTTLQGALVGTPARDSEAQSTLDIPSADTTSQRLESTLKINVNICCNVQKRHLLIRSVLKHLSLQLALQS